MIGWVGVDEYCGGFGGCWMGRFGWGGERKGDCGGMLMERANKTAAEMI